MKKLLVATAFVAFAATPVLAQQGPWWAWGPAQPEPYAQTYMYAPAQPDALAQEGPFVSMAPSTAVVADGKIIGQDPDPIVRMMLQRSTGLTSPSEN